MNQNGRNMVLNLRGLLYFEDFHFVSWTVDIDGVIWYNDGRSMGFVSTIDGTLQSMSNDDLWNKGSNVLVAVLYAQM